jgi:hypothetical protein
VVAAVPGDDGVVAVARFARDDGRLVVVPVPLMYRSCIAAIRPNNASNSDGACAREHVSSLDFLQNLPMT